MPEFQQNPYGVEDFHEGQLKHYGLKRHAPTPATSVAPQAQASGPRNEATGMPVPPKRKPVGGTIQPPAARPPSSGPASPRVQTEAGTRLIFVGADGRFDPSSIRTEGSKYTPPASPTVPSSSRPASRASSKAPLKRTDSNNSKSSWRSRRNSAGQAVRRLSVSLKEKAEIFGMDKNERTMFVRGKYNSTEDGEEAQMKARPGRSGSISRGEKIALNISKAVDPIKPRARRGTNDSSMSMDMVDTAPEGELHPCERCHAPIFDFATKGLCQQCHKEAKDVETEPDPLQYAQTRHTYPLSHKDGHMKLPSRRILRVRQTIYEDPGNPFADDDDSGGVKLAQDVSEREDIPERPTTALVSFTEMSSRSATNRGSKSVALPAPSFWTAEDEYVAPRTLWRKESAPPGSSLDTSSTSDTRNTKFYGFYDDVMRDYL